MTAASNEYSEDLNEKEDKSAPFTNYAWIALLLLFLTRLCLQQQQQAIGFVYGFAGAGNDLTKARSFYEITQAYPSISKYYGLLSGAGFSISYAIAGVLWGIAADKYNRKRIITVACFGWSITSLLTGQINSLAVLALMRFFLGMCQSAFLPSSFSILQDYFPPNKLALANSMITSAPLIGAGLSSLSVIAIASIGWRACFKLMALFGFGVGSIGMLFLKEPKRGQMKPKSQQVPVEQDDTPIIKKFFSSLKDLTKNPVSKFCVYGGCFRYISMFVQNYFLPVFFLQAYPNHIPQIAVLFSFQTVFAGVLSSVIGGIISDRYGQKDPSVYSKVAQTGSLLALPALCISTLFLNNYPLAMVMTTLYFLFGECSWGTNITMIQKSNPPEKFGNVVSVYQFFTILTGCLTTAVMGGLINYFDAAKNVKIIGQLLAIISSVGYIGSIYCWRRAGQEFDKQIKSKLVTA